MKLRYQMRGLGIGIIVTALLMGVAKEDRIPMSDAEIRVRALELGMIERDSRKLSDMLQASGSSGAAGESYGVDAVPIEGDSASKSDEAPEGTEGISGSMSGEEEGAEGASGSSSGEGEGTAGDSGQEEEASPDAPSDLEGVEDGPVTFVIEGGATSYSVCQKLAEAGLVEDASVFDDYLCDMGYSRSVREGTFQIPAGASQEEIAEIITGKR